MRTVDDKIVVALHQIRDAIKNKECCGGGESSDSSSKEITIDDVVKFINDNTENELFFNYVKYNDIQNIPEVIEGNQIYVVKGTSEEFDKLGLEISINYILHSKNYNIAEIYKSTIG